MGISFSNIGTVGREQLITSGSNGEPNWSYIPSKGKSTKTQTEFVKAFVDAIREAIGGELTAETMAQLNSDRDDSCRRIW